MAKSIKELHNKHKGSDIWILGSGASLNHVIDSFFDNKIVIGINRMYKHFKCNYIILHHFSQLKEALKSRAPVVASIKDQCTHDGIQITDLIHVNRYNNLYIYNHYSQGYMRIDYSCFDDPEMLVIGGTTAINAISLACHLGAKNIMLCGIDGGTLDDQVNINDYRDDNSKANQINQLGHSLRTRKLIKEYRDFLRIEDINLYSLNPFCDMGYEGHKFKNTFI